MDVDLCVCERTNLLHINNLCQLFLWPPWKKKTEKKLVECLLVDAFALFFRCLLNMYKYFFFMHCVFLDFGCFCFCLLMPNTLIKCIPLSFVIIIIINFFFLKSSLFLFHFGHLVYICISFVLSLWCLYLHFNSLLELFGRCTSVVRIDITLQKILLYLFKKKEWSTLEEESTDEEHTFYEQK